MVALLGLIPRVSIDLEQMLLTRLSRGHRWLSRGAKEQNKGPPMRSLWEVSDVRSKKDTFKVDI